MEVFLPLFPLNLVVFPEEKLNLHIFEPRYKQLIKECVKEGINFGIVSVIDGKLMDFGTEIQVLEIAKEYANGEMDIRTKGLRQFEVKEFFEVSPDKLYPGGQVVFITTDKEGDLIVNLSLIHYLKKLYSLMRIDREVSENPDYFFSYEVGHYIGFTPRQEFEFLKIKSERDRQEFLLRHFERMIPIVEEMEKLKERIRLNGHFKDAIPPDLFKK